MIRTDLETEEKKEIILDIPIADARRCCLRDIKYLHFLGSIVVGVREGVVQRLQDEEEGGNWVAVAVTAPFNAGKRYRYCVNGNVPGEEVLQFAVNPATWKEDGSQSGTGNKSPEFSDSVRARDVCCVFTHRYNEGNVRTEALDEAAHIFPYSRGDAVHGRTLCCVW